MLIMASTENKDPTFSLKLYTSHGKRPYDLTNLNQKSTPKKIKKIKRLRQAGLKFLLEEYHYHRVMQN